MTLPDNYPIQLPVVVVEDRKIKLDAITTATLEQSMRAFEKLCNSFSVYEQPPQVVSIMQQPGVVTLVYQETILKTRTIETPEEYDQFMQGLPQVVGALAAAAGT